MAKTNRKIVADVNGQQTMLHSLESCTDLKLEDSNHLLFSQIQDKLIVSVQEQYQSNDGETYF